MKYFVLIPDGMADRKVPELGNMTPMEAAKKPNMDALAAKSTCGTVLNVPKTMVPESDTANLAILSYDPLVYSKGRSPLEAVSMGLEMKDGDVAFRCNVVTLTEEEENYNDKKILDHSADEITTEEARELVKALDAALCGGDKRLYCGVSYRHCLLWNGVSEKTVFMRPHDILGKTIGEYMPSGENAEACYDFMRRSYDILNHHPVNEARRARGLRPANSAWLWSPGKKPSLPSFSEKWGVSGAVISAVDLIKGIGLCAKMESINVDGATGNYDTNYTGKANAAIDCFKRGVELVYVHVEAPDECGHRGEIDKKVGSIEKIDELILKPVYEYLSNSGDSFKILVLPDHPTPLEIRTHSSEPVPFFLYDSEKDAAGVSTFTEDICSKTDLYIADGSTLLSRMISK